MFVASCKPGLTFRQLWDIDTGTKGRSLIVPDGDTLETDLKVATWGWREMVTALSHTGAAVATAKAYANVRLNVLVPPDPA